MIKKDSLKRISKKAFPYVLIVLISFLATLPFLIFTEVKHMSDNMFHYSAINALNQAWQDGHFGTRIYDIISQDYGYPIGLFYSMLPASITVIIINVLNVSVSTALFIQFFSLFVVSGLITYFFLKRVFKGTKPWIVLFATCIYILFPYTLYCLYSRFAFSEVYISLAIPLIAWGVYELLEKNSYRAFFPLFACGSLIALFFHFTLFVYIYIFVAIYCLLHFKKFFRKHLYIPMLIAGLVTLLLGAVYWYPMLINYGDSYAGNLARSPRDFFGIAVARFLKPYNLLPLAIIIVCSIVFWKKRKTITPSGIKFFIITLLMYFVTTPIFPWFLMPRTLYMIQFGYRVFGIVSILVVIMMVFIFKNVKNRISMVLVCVTTIFVAVYSLDFIRIYGPYPINSITENETYLASSFGVGTQLKNSPAIDYYPKSIKSAEDVFKRANNKMVNETESNTEVYEFANYQSLNQISFVLKGVQLSRSVSLNLPSVLFDEDVDVKCLILFKNTVTTNPERSSNVGQHVSDITIDKSSQFVKINIESLEPSMKVIINYTPQSALAQYLHEHPFEFLSLDQTSDWDKIGGSYATKFVKTGVNYTVRFENVTQEVTVELPTFYFKGYELTYLTDGGETVNIQLTQSDNGFIKVTVDTSGKLSVVYTGGNYLKIGNAISIAGIGFLVISMIGIFVYPVVKRRLFNKKWTNPM